MMLTSLIETLDFWHQAVAVPAAILNVIILSTAGASILAIAMIATVKPTGTALNLRMLRKQRGKLRKMYKSKKAQKNHLVRGKEDS